MSSFQFSDEEKPQPSTPPPADPRPSAPPPANAPAAAPAEEEDDFSFLAQPPADAPAANAPAANAAAANAPAANAPAQSQAAVPQQNAPAGGRPNAQPAAPAPGARPKAGEAQARMQGQPTQRPQAKPAQPAQPQPLRAGTGAASAPRVPDPLSPTAPQSKGKVKFEPNPVAPDLSLPGKVHPVGVPNPTAAPNPAAAAALTPTPDTPTAEQVTGMEAGDKIAAGFFGMGSTIRLALNKLESPASWALRVFGVVGILCLAFLLAALFFGGVNTLGAANAKTADVIRNLSYAAKGFSVCLFVSAVAALLLSYDDNKIGAIYAALGVLLMFGTPLLIKAVAGESEAGTFVGPAVIPSLTAAGKALFILGAIKGTIDLFDFLYKLPDRVRSKVANVGQGRPTEAKQRAIASQANMMSPCWKLPFCRESIRVLCPAFIAKKTCWKFGRGCYCDEEMIGRIVRGEPMASISAPTRISQSKPPCGRCYIYLEHQTYKFRMLSPLALPLTILIAYAGYPLYRMAFGVFDKGLQSVWGMFSFAPKLPDAIATSQENIDKVANTAMNATQISGFASSIIGVMLGFFLLIYISKGIEWAIFKAKL